MAGLYPVVSLDYRIDLLLSNGLPSVMLFTPFSVATVESPYKSLVRTLNYCRLYIGFHAESHYEHRERVISMQEATGTQQ